MQIHNSKILHYRESIILVKDTSVTADGFTGSLSASYSQGVYIGGLDSSFIVVTGLTAALTAQVNNLDETNTNFNSGWYNFTTMAATANPRFLSLTGSNARYVRFFAGSGNDIDTTEIAFFNGHCSHWTS